MIRSIKSMNFLDPELCQTGPMLGLF
uniref:Uncharacterized protein n=1 Tax=Arundo donax TaxID=35708 RepID=A0A0A8ZRC2_ARUDO